VKYEKIRLSALTVAPLGGNGRLRIAGRAIRHHGVHGCCTSAVGNKKGGGIGVRDVGGEKKGSRGRVERWRRGGSACVPHAPINVATLAVSNHRDPLAAPCRIRVRRDPILSLSPRSFDRAFPSARARASE